MISLRASVHQRRQALRRGNFPTVADLVAAIERFMVGEPCVPARLAELRKEAQERYSKKVPPGLSA
jgi:hypothetical protein